MRPVTEAAIAALAVTGSLWLFQDTLTHFMVEKDLIEKNTLDDLVLTVGDTEPCKADVHYRVWDEMMNELDMYRWIIACEDARKKETSP